MINQVIIEIEIIRDKENDDRIRKLLKNGIKSAYVNMMREIYQSIKNTYDCPHIRIEGIFDDERNFDMKNYYHDEDKNKFLEILLFKFYLEFEDDVDFIGGNDLYDLFDMELSHINGDEVYLGYIGHAETDFDFIIEDDVDWTMKKSIKG